MPLADPTRPDVWTDISNAVPTPHGTYRNAPGFKGSGTTPASPGSQLRAWQGIDLTGTATKILGTGTKLYVFTTTFTDRSIGGGYTNTAADWSLAQYGKFTIATNWVDAPQVRDASTNNAFANLGGTPPTTAKIVVSQNGAVIFFNTNTAANHFQASDLLNHANYTTGESFGGYIYQRSGPITGAVAFRDYTLVFKENSCYRVTYVGSPYYYTVELISDAHGAIGQYSAVPCGDQVVVCDHKNGAYIFDGATFRRIDEGIKAYLVQLVFAPIASQYFKNQESIWWQIATTAFLTYNLQSGAWGKFTAQAPDSQAVTLNAAAQLLVGQGAYDEMRGATIIDISQATYPILASYAEDEAAGTDNTALDGYVTSGLVGTHGRMTLVSRVTPTLKTPDSIIGTTNVPAASAMTLTPYSQTNPEGTATAGTAVACSTTAEKRFDFTKSAQWQKFKLTFANSPWEIDDLPATAVDGGASQ